MLVMPTKVPMRLEKKASTATKIAFTPIRSASQQQPTRRHFVNSVNKQSSFTAWPSKDSEVSIPFRDLYPKSMAQIKVIGAPMSQTMALTSTPRSSWPSPGKSHAERLTSALSEAYSRRNYVDLTITLRDQVCMTNLNMIFFLAYPGMGKLLSGEELGNLSYFSYFFTQ